jgi:hypothetical protein
MGSPQGQLAICLREWQTSTPIWACGVSLRAKILATAIAACTQYLAATWGRLASKETMAALAHEIARLECPLHIVLKMSKLMGTNRLCRTNKKGRPGRRPHIERAVRRRRPMSQEIAAILLYTESLSMSLDKLFKTLHNSHIF